MVTNDELLEAIELLGKVVTKTAKITNDRIDNIVNLLTLKENEEKPVEKKEEPTATNHQGNNTVGPGIVITDDPNHGEVPIKHKNIPKGNYVRYTNKHCELKAAPEIETEKGIKLYIDDLKEGFGFLRWRLKIRSFK